MEVRYTGNKNYPIEISNTYSTVAIHRFDLADDDDWNEFIDQLNFFRERYIDGSLERLQNNIKKSKKKKTFFQKCLTFARTCDII